jgi:hypothetical protein
MKIKCYDLDCNVKFGKYAGLSIEKIIDFDYNYLIWCLMHLSHFHLSEEVYDQISKKHPTFVIAEDLQQIIEQKQDLWGCQIYESSERKPTYKKYEGTYAQDIEGLSDDFIDDVLDGCPDAYWNID